MELKVEYDEDNGVIRFKMPREAGNSDFSEETGERFLEHLEYECQGIRERLLLLDLRDCPSDNPSRKFRKWMRNNSEKMKFKRTAVSTDSAVIRVLSKFIMAAAGKLKETQFFPDEKEAMVWLKEENGLTGV